MTKRTAAERRERTRLRPEHWRRAHGIMPRRPAQKPWFAEGISRRRGNRISTRLVDLPGTENRRLRSLKSDTRDAFARAEAFVAALQADLARAARAQAVMRSCLDEMCHLV